MTFGGKETPAFEPVDCARLIREMSQVLRVSISKSAVLRTELADDLGMIHGNPAQLQQLVMNLIVNASQAIGDRKGEIFVRARMLTPRERAACGLTHTEYVQVEVADTGPGMDDETKTRMFDPFFTTKTGGRGLGLAVVRGVVRAHDGMIKLVSSPGCGATFQVLLPCLPRCSASGPEAENGTTEGAAAQKLFASRTVLMIEDEKMLRASVAAMLRKRGLTVIEAEDGNHGVERFIADRPRIDAVLLDLTLPGKTGRAVLEELQGIAPDVKVIVTSAYGQEHVRHLLGGLRASGYIQKPYRIAQVETVLQKCFVETGLVGFAGV
jgi:CheY-like chemotaxis protein